MPSHFIKYLKQWRKNQDRRDAEISSGSNILREVVEHIPETQPIQNFNPVGLGPPNINPTPKTESDSVVQPPVLGALPLLANTSYAQPNLEETLPKRKKMPKSCKVVHNGMQCPDPLNCLGRINRKNCILITGGDPTKKTKRKILKISGPFTVSFT